MPHLQHTHTPAGHSVRTVCITLVARIRSLLHLKLQLLILLLDTLTHTQNRPVRACDNNKKMHKVCCTGCAAAQATKNSTKVGLASSASVCPATSSAAAQSNWTGLRRSGLFYQTSSYRGAPGSTSSIRSPATEALPIRHRFNQICSYRGAPNSTSSIRSPATEASPAASGHP